jgi:hypothetical protein
MAMRLLMMAVLWVAVPSAGQAAGSTAHNWLIAQGYAAPTSTQIIACHGYGCARRMPVPIRGPWFERAAALLSAARSSPAAERAALRKVVRLYTGMLGASFGGRPDRPRSPPGESGRNGQMDCLDATANTTSLLLVLQDARLLTHHRVERPQSRGIFLDGRYPHFTAVIMEKRGSGRWAIDPWARPPGQDPDILPLGVWQQAS